MLTNITGINYIIISLLYGCGLRVKDINFEYNNIYTYDSKSLKDMVIPLPLKIKTQLKEQISRIKTIYQKDLQNEYGAVYIPYNLAKKYLKRYKMAISFSCKKYSN